MYYNNLTHIIIQMGFKSRFSIRTLFLTEGGKSLVDFHEDFNTLVVAYQPDIIVLQDYSQVPGGYYVSSKYNRQNTLKSLETQYSIGMLKWQKMKPDGKVVILSVWGRPGADRACPELYTDNKTMIP
eukprot:UN16166